MAFIDHESVQSKRIRWTKSRIESRTKELRAMMTRLALQVDHQDWDAAWHICHNVQAALEGLRDDSNTLADIE